MIQFGAMAALGGLSALSSIVGSAADAAKNKSGAASLFAPSADKTGEAAKPTTAARASSTFSPSTMASLIDIQSQQTDGTSASSDSSKSLFSKLDADGDGSISKSELENAFAGSENSKIKDKAASLADALMNKADSDGDGKISETEMKAAQKAAQARRPPPPVMNAQMAAAIQAMTATNAGTAASFASSAVASV